MFFGVASQFHISTLEVPPCFARSLRTDFVTWYIWHLKCRYPRKKITENICNTEVNIFTSAFDGLHTVIVLSYAGTIVTKVRMWCILSTCTWVVSIIHITKTRYRSYRTLMCYIALLGLVISGILLATYILFTHSRGCFTGACATIWLIIY